MTHEGVHSITNALYRLADLGVVGRRVAATLDAARGARLASPAQRKAAARIGAGRRFDAAKRALYDRVWSESAAAVGAATEPIGGGFLALRRNGAETIVRESFVMLDSTPNLELALAKPVLNPLLEAAGLPVAASVVTGRAGLATALEFVQAHPGPFVLKPTRTGAGNGVIGGLVSTDDVGRAFIAAGRTFPNLIVEQAVSGHEYRLLFLDCELVDTIERHPPTLRGDGTSTVLELAAAENRRRAEAAPDDVARPLRVDLDLELCLGRQGYRLSSVIPKDREVPAKSTISDNAAADNTTLADPPGALVEDARRAVRVSRLRLAGVDVITPDPTRPLAEVGGVVLEVNGTPGLHHHYWTRGPTPPTPVAIPILDRLLEDAALRNAPRR